MGVDASLCCGALTDRFGGVCALFFRNRIRIGRRLPFADANADAVGSFGAPERFAGGLLLDGFIQAAFELLIARPLNIGSSKCVTLGDLLGAEFLLQVIVAHVGDLAGFLAARFRVTVLCACQTRTQRADEKKTPSVHSCP